MKRIDYDKALYRTYDRGRAHSPESYRLWMKAIARYVPRKSGPVVLDLGSGTGRFSPQLAEYFDARVVGVEPSDKMRAVAEESNAHPMVRYVKGAAENIPLGEAECDFAFLSMVIHHVDDLAECCRELRRVLKPRGTVLIRNSFKNRLVSVPFYDFFPNARAVDNERLPGVEEVEAVFLANGFRRVAFETIRQQIDASLADHYERIKTKSLSTFELISEEEFQAGVAAMKRAVEGESAPGPIVEDIDLLVFEKRDAAL